MSLENLGWSDKLEKLKNKFNNIELSPARVLSVHRRQLLIHDGQNHYEIPTLGRWFKNQDSQGPAVGDWLLVARNQPQHTQLLPRLNAVKRNVANQNEPQTIAANVDLIFVVVSSTEEFNESKLERYLALAELSDATPHIILSKKDLVPNVVDIVNRITRLAYRSSLAVVDCRDVNTLGALRNLLAQGVTGLFFGSSGVGKSTLINSLIGAQIQQTAATREYDQKGRHTTSSRKLFILREGGIIIDIPGVRELDVTGTKSRLELTFPDIETLISRCKFVNCTHRDEPDCHIRAALQQGALVKRRYKNYSALM